MGHKTIFQMSLLILTMLVKFSGMLLEIIKMVHVKMNIIFLKKWYMFLAQQCISNTFCKLINFF